ncbi:flavoprotein [Endozoicomonas montiporae]|uniref:Flavoprotein n=2 Tax=Endozoicomonas montiporae TaxID=1027273 RepID=A0A081N620_9GAMM|nr:NAD(P)H-dependent oxidoreductase [Endozoicomonas montiporae]AMO57189.1 [acyl-carrier-protein] phosphodiesterase [Endozoicomonas montiporae CL-33]KEQ13893.1 flavoprotein [Endozoicomonas montiporae]
MKLTIITGSHRRESQSERIGHVLSERVAALGLFDECEVFSLSGNPLPLWDEVIFSGDEQWKALLSPLKQKLRESDAFVVVSPEWNGMVPSALKNFFLLFGALELGHKPALITAVSSGQGGSYPVAELRMSSYKNARLCFIPEHLIVRGVESALNGEDPAADALLQDRADYALKLLGEYSKALRQVRASGVVDHKTFRNGM